MIPNPYIQLLDTPSTALDLEQAPSAAICVYPADKSLLHLQAEADKAGLALIRTAEKTAQDGSDGFWSTDPNLIKSLRQQNSDWQLVGVANDRHTAMTLGEAGADLILFGHLDPIVVAGDVELARWWSDLFEVPCGLILNDQPAEDWPFGEPGWPEFFAIQAR